MVAESTQESYRPYAPPSNVVSLLRRLRSRNLPERIDMDYLRDAGVPDGSVPRTFAAVKFLRFIDEDGTPMPVLRSIHTSTDDEYRTILADVVRNAYADVFNIIDPATEGQERLLNFFRRYTPASQRNRMVIFFLGLAREAGIPTVDVPRQRGMSTSRPPTQRTTKLKPAPRQTRKGSAGSPRQDQPNIAPALEGLIRSLPEPGQPMSPQRRKQWVMMAEATLAFIYPEGPDFVLDISEPSGPDEDEDFVNDEDV